MANLAATIVDPGSDTSELHRHVVRVGAAASWLATAILLVLGFFSGDETMLFEAFAPLLAGAFMTIQILSKRENASIALLAAVIVVGVWYSLLGNEGALVPAAVSLVVTGALAVMLVERFVYVALSVMSAALLGVPHLWALDTQHAWLLGVVMALSFSITSVILMSVRTAISHVNARFQALFENSPTAVLEEDWSEAVAYVRYEYTGRPDRVRPFLLAYPAVVRKAVSLAKVLRVNQAALELFDLEDPQRLLGNRDSDDVTDETIEAYVEALVALYEKRTVFDHELPAWTAKGCQVWLQANAVDTSADASGSRIIVGLVDITHMKARADEMSQLVKSKDNFIAQVSHELRTPLTAVLGLAAELSSEQGLAEEHRELLGLVAGQADEMSHIVEDLLVAARAEIGTVAIDQITVDLHGELKRTLDALGISVSEAPGSLEKVHADPNRVRQILRNLLTNAERYGGPERRILAGHGGNYVWLEVRDNGDGVPGDMSEGIFDAYASAHDGLVGSIGLGLSVSRQLAVMMGGSLTYERDRHETVFRLELPSASCDMPALASNRSNT